MDGFRAQIRAFFTRSFPHHAWKDNEDIFQSGMVDSMFAMQLVMFLEKEFAVAISDDDLDIDNFRTIDAMTALVTRKNAAPMAQV